MENNFIEKIKKVFKQNKIDLTDEQADKFYKYYELLKEWNEKINLTTIIQEDDVIVKHFLDSAMFVNNLNNNCKVLDLGTGAGFPGIPLKILREDLQITLVDSVNKKILFLEEVIKELNLKNISAIHSRIEDLALKTEFRETFDVVVSRAVSRLNVLCEYSLPFLKIGGKMLSYKSVEASAEVDEAQKALSILGGKFVKIEEKSFCNMSRNLVVIAKIVQTSKKYPRGGNKPRLNPIV